MQLLIDIVFEKVFSHVDAESDSRPHFGTESAAPFPESLSGPVQYGSGIKAYALYLLMAQMISLRRVQQTIRTLIGQIISATTILEYGLQLHLALERWEHMAIDRVLIQPATHVDETSIRVDKHNHWIHLCSAGDITLKFVHEKRDLEATAAIGIIPGHGGVIVHDCWASYLSYEHCRHGLCCAHLLRELTLSVEANGYTGNMKRLLQRTCSRVCRRKRKRLSPREHEAWQKHYRNVLTRVERELPPIPAKQNGKRGGDEKSDVHNLGECLKKHESAVLLFVQDQNVRFTNNRSERDRRMSKVKTENSRLLSRSRVRPDQLSHLQLSAVHGQSRLQPFRRYPNGAIRAARRRKRRE